MRTFLTSSANGGHYKDGSGTSGSGQLRATRLNPSPALRPEERRPLVMLVDDDPAIGAMYGVGLEAAGFRVIVLSSVSAIFLALEEEIPDIVVLDFHLGDLITGVDVLENFRLDSRTTHVPTVMLTNHLGELDGQIALAFAAGAIGWLVKSQTTPAELGLHISRVLDSLVRDRGCTTSADSST